MKARRIEEVSPLEVERIVRMAWEDRTTFDAIREQFRLSPGNVIKLMRRELSPSAFRAWRKRTSGRTTKHDAKFVERVGRGEPRRFRSKSQRG